MNKFSEKTKNGKKGGKSTFKKYGSTHFSKIGARGAKKRWAKLQAEK